MKMNTSTNPGSATIYQFPAGGRTALNGRRYGETKPASERSSNIASSSCWYHDEAIRESGPADEHSAEKGDW